MSILILATGGTFDKEYDELTGRLDFADAHLSHMLELGRSRLEVSVRTAMLVDSLEMTAEHRELLVAHCRRARESRIVITHGTDTMVETAAVLARGLEGAGKTKRIDKNILHFIRKFGAESARV